MTDMTRFPQTFERATEMTSNGDLGYHDCYETYCLVEFAEGECAILCYCPEEHLLFKAVVFNSDKNTYEENKEAATVAFDDLKHQLATQDIEDFSSWIEMTYPDEFNDAA